MTDIKLLAKRETQNAVYYDSVNGVAGTAWPIGTAFLPVNNEANLRTIVAARNASYIFISGALSITSSWPTNRDYVFEGKNHKNDNITSQVTIVGPGLDVTRITFRNVYFETTSSMLIGLGPILEECIIGNVGISASIDSDIRYAKNCLIQGQVFLNIGFLENCVFTDEYNYSPQLSVQGGNFVVINCRIGGGRGNDNGQLIIGDNVNGILDLYGGQIVFLATCTGTVTVSGTCDILDQSAGGVTIIDRRNRPRAEVAVNITAILAAETNVFNLAVATIHYNVDTLILKSADPGANNVTVRLYQLVNGASTLIKTFTITTVNFATYFTLMDMFGVPHLAGDNIRITVQATAGGPYVVVGSYCFRSA